MNLVKERLAWEAKYSLGEKCYFKPYKDYKENRLSEYYRSSKLIEEFYEYVRVLESKLEDLNNG